MADIVVKESDLQSAGDNVKVCTVGDLMVLVIDTKKSSGLSSTGKMRTVANTSGFTMLPAGLKGNVYIGRKV